MAFSPALSHLLQLLPTARRLPAAPSLASNSISCQRLHLLPTTPSPAKQHHILSKAPSLSNTKPPTKHAQAPSIPFMRPVAAQYLYHPTYASRAHQTIETPRNHRLLATSLHIRYAQLRSHDVRLRQHSLTRHCEYRMTPILAKYSISPHPNSYTLLQPLHSFKYCKFRHLFHPLATTHYPYPE